MPERPYAATAGLYIRRAVTAFTGCKREANYFFKFKNFKIFFKKTADDWKEKYLLIALIEGKISFTTFLQENQPLQLSNPKSNFLGMSCYRQL